MDPGFIEGAHTAFVQYLRDSPDMRKTVRSSFQQSLYAGGGAMMGGMIGGPVGGLVGGIAGSITGYMKADDYDGMVLSLSSLDASDKERLLKNVAGILMKAGMVAQGFSSVANFQTAVLEYCAQPDVRKQIWNACTNVLAQARN